MALSRTYNRVSKIHMGRYTEEIMITQRRDVRLITAMILSILLIAVL